jgi:hypothetical protein
MEEKEKLHDVLITPFQEQPGATAITEGDTQPAVETLAADGEVPADRNAAPATGPAPLGTHQASSVKKPLFAGLATCLACSCVGIPAFILVTLVVLMLVDPLSLHVWGRLNGKYDSAAEIMPADTGLYLGINIGNALLTRVDRVVGPMAASEQNDPSTVLESYHASFSAAEAQQASIIDDMLASILDSSGINVPEDLTPWIGQYAGVGIFNARQDNNNLYTGPQFLFALEARNLTRADAFLETLQVNLAALRGMKFNRENYKGHNLYVEDVSGSGDTLAFGRVDRMVMIAADVSLLKNAIDSQGKTSLDQQADYSQLVDQRSRGWSASIYLDAENYQAVMESMMAQDPGANLMLYNQAYQPAWESMLMNASVIKNGLSFDTYLTYNTPAGSTTGSGTVQFNGQSFAKIIGLLPQDTVVYLAMPNFDMVSQSIISLAFANGSDPSILYDSFEEYFGFSLTDDFLNHLNGQWVVYVVPSAQGMLPQQSDLDLAISLLIEADNQLDLDMITGKLALAGQIPGLDIQTSLLDGVTYYEVSQSSIDEPILAYGQSNGYFALGTDINVLQASFTNDTPLVNNAGYLEATHNLAAGMQPFGFMDLESMFASLRERMGPDELQSFNESVGILDHISRVIMASRVLPHNISHNSIVVIMKDQ